MLVLWYGNHGYGSFNAESDIEDLTEPKCRCRVFGGTMAAHAQKGLPAFSIYGRDVQDSDDSTIPNDVAEKILRFAKAAAQSVR